MIGSYSHTVPNMLRTKGAHLASAISAMALVVFLPRPESQGQVQGPNPPVILTYPEIPRLVRHCQSLVPMGAPVEEFHLVIMEF